MNDTKPTRWFRRISALGELHGDTNQSMIADRLGVSRSAVSNWKYGTIPDADTVINAAVVYDVDALELLELTFIEADSKESP